MSDFQQLIICEDDDKSVETVVELDFTTEQVDRFGFNSAQTLESIIFQILKKPTALVAHLQRIYFCYRHNLTENLFAALVDLLIILEGRGHFLGCRMVKGAKPRLHPDQYKILMKALEAFGDEVRLLTGNMYSVFSKGLIGTHVLVIRENIKVQQEHDPLDIAHDFIAYSQLDDAMELLENAILVDLERQALHDDLLELYKVTQSFERFMKMYDMLAGQVKNVPAGWNELKGFFNER
jgi:hypothetical protein